jgi:TRAP-type C4-dicarboxylate transport system permease small subunit
VVASAADVPPTRKHELASVDPPSRPSATQLEALPEGFPDDGPLSAKVRTADRYLGMVEQVVLVALLLAVVFVGALQALSTKLANHSFPWSFDVIRGGTFAIAMLAAAYASQQGSHISMDILTRKAPPRVRLGMRVALGFVTLFAVSLLVWMGLRMVEKLAKEGGDHTIPAHWLAMLIPIGGGLIMLHTLLRMVVDADYLVRRKLPPEKAPSAH